LEPVSRKDSSRKVYNDGENVTGRREDLPNGLDWEPGKRGGRETKRKGGGGPGFWGFFSVGGGCFGFWVFVWGVGGFWRGGVKKP